MKLVKKHYGKETDLNKGIVNGEYTAGITLNNGTYITRAELRKRIVDECRKYPWYRNKNRKELIEYFLSPAFLKPISGSVVSYVAKKAADDLRWMEGL